MSGAYRTEEALATVSDVDRERVEELRGEESVADLLGRETPADRRQAVAEAQVIDAALTQILPMAQAAARQDGFRLTAERSSSGSVYVTLRASHLQTEAEARETARAAARVFRGLPAGTHLFVIVETPAGDRAAKRSWIVNPNVEGGLQ